MRCAVPSCKGAVEPINELGVCVDCRRPASYGDHGIQSVYDEVLPGMTQMTDELFEGLDRDW